MNRVDERVGGVRQTGRVLLNDLVRASESVRATRSRKAKVAALAEALSRAAPETFEAMSRVAGSGSQATRAALAGELFGRATSEEQAYLRGLVTGELRQGAL